MLGGALIRRAFVNARSSLTACLCYVCAGRGRVACGDRREPIRGRACCRTVARETCYTITVSCGGGADPGDLRCVWSAVPVRGVRVASGSGSGHSTGRATSSGLFALWQHSLRLGFGAWFGASACSRAHTRHDSPRVTSVTRRAARAYPTRAAEPRSPSFQEGLRIERTRHVLSRQEAAWKGQ